MRREDPQPVALVLSHLDPDTGAQVLPDLPAELRGDVVRRVATLEGLNVEFVTLIDRGLERRVAGLAAQMTAGPRGAKTAAEILNRADRSVERHVLAEIGAEEASAGRVRRCECGRRRRPMPAGPPPSTASSPGGVRTWPPGRPG